MEKEPIQENETQEPTDIYIDKRPSDIRESSAEQLGKLIKSRQIGWDRFYIGVLVAVGKTDNRQFGRVIKIHNIHDPIYDRKKDSLPVITVQYEDGSIEEIPQIYGSKKIRVLYEILPLSAKKLEKRRTEITNLPEIYKKSAISEFNGTEFFMGQAVWIGKTPGRITEINFSGEKPIIMVLAKNNTGKEKIYKVYPETLLPTEIDDKGETIRLSDYRIID